MQDQGSSRSKHERGQDEAVRVAAQVCKRVGMQKHRRDDEHRPSVADRAVHADPVGLLFWGLQLQKRQRGIRPGVTRSADWG